MKPKRTTRTKKTSSANTKSKKTAKRAVRKSEAQTGAPKVIQPPVLLVVGEESGDLLASSILREVLKQKKIPVWGCGGTRLKAAGLKIRYNSEELSTIGFFEAAKNYRRLTKIIKALVEEAKANGTREAWLVDFPGFNMLLAKRLKAVGIRSTMIVSPTVWAWKYKRVFKIRDNFERVLCLYDFEPEIYHKLGVEAHYIGHPLTQETVALKKKFRDAGNPLKKNPAISAALKKKSPIVAIMPGSRPSEIHYHTERILEGVRRFQIAHPGCVFVLPAANEKIHKLLSDYELPLDTYLVKQSAPFVLDVATAAIACSGTVTLECALFGVPHLILYRSSWTSYAIFKRVIRIPYIGMVNVLAGRFIVPEFLQRRFTPKNIAMGLEKLLYDEEFSMIQKTELKRIADRLTSRAPAEAAAKILLQNYS